MINKIKKQNYLENIELQQLLYIPLTTGIVHIKKTSHETWPNSLKTLLPF